MNNRKKYLPPAASVVFNEPPVRALGAIFILIAIATVSLAQDKPRVFVAESASWEIKGGGSGGARPQTAEIIKTFGQKCKECIVTINKDRADYIIVLEHEGGKNIVRKDNKWALFNRDGDAIGSGSTRALGSAVKDACNKLKKHWASDRNDERRRN